ncbi:hypothetical protein K3888_13380 [Dietzia aurantiaca]|uniref:hypothetical protein n=1 Tax=Dietzia aurantiaca TaxID=983873 RepID=UPI001E2E6B62|nr:hypothetical protein [Dietzia aurantiaca]MCD2263692.1 hypothetical protein [Dietzia aurantiaca]
MTGELANLRTADQEPPRCGIPGCDKTATQLSNGAVLGHFGKPFVGTKFPAIGGVFDRCDEHGPSDDPHEYGFSMEISRTQCLDQGWVAYVIDPDTGNERVTRDFWPTEEEAVAAAKRGELIE